MKIKSFDTAIVFSDTLTIDGVAADLSSTTVLFILKAADDTVFSAAATVDADPTTGAVTYVPSAGFPTTAGSYKQEWEVTFLDTTKLTFPSDGYNKVTIIEDLNAV